MDKERFNDKEWEKISKEDMGNLGFPISKTKWVELPARCGKMVRVRLPARVPTQEQ